MYANKRDYFSSDFWMADRPIFLLSYRLPYGEVVAWIVNISIRQGITNSLRNIIIHEICHSIPPSEQAINVKTGLHLWKQIL